MANINEFTSGYLRGARETLQAFMNFALLNDVDEEEGADFGKVMKDLKKLCRNLSTDIDGIETTARQQAEAAAKAAEEAQQNESDIPVETDENV